MSCWPSDFEAPQRAEKQRREKRVSSLVPHRPVNNVLNEMSDGQLTHCQARRVGVRSDLPTAGLHQTSNVWHDVDVNLGEIG